MFKKLLPGLAGVVTGVIVLSVAEMWMAKVFPAPEGLLLQDPVALKAYVAGMPKSAFLMLLAGYVISAFSGGLIATLVGGTESPRPAVITGAVLMVGGIFNLIQIPHPVWFSTLSTACYVPSAVAAYFLVKKLKAS